MEETNGLENPQSEKLLQFLRRCLESRDPSFSNVIKYIDATLKNDFRVVDPQRLAFEWGKQKGKELTLKKLNRSLTYLVKTKKQLKKLSKWRFRFVKEKHGFPSSPSSTSSQSSSDKSLVSCGSNFSSTNIHDMPKTITSLPFSPKDCISMMDHREREEEYAHSALALHSGYCSCNSQKPSVSLSTQQQTCDPQPSHNFLVKFTPVSPSTNYHGSSTRDLPIQELHNRTFSTGLT